jgi:hypothetical protein
MLHSPFWKAHSSSASQEIFYISENMKVYYHNPKSLPFVTILNQNNLVHTQKWIFIWSCVILSSHLHLDLPSGTSYRFLHQNPVYTVPLPCICHTSHPSHSWSNDTYNIWWWVQTMKLLTVQFSLALCDLISLRSKYFLTSPYSQTPSVYVLPPVWENQVPHPYKTITKITVSNILILIFLESKLADKRF